MDRLYRDYHVSGAAMPHNLIPRSRLGAGVNSPADRIQRTCDRERPGGHSSTRESAVSPPHAGNNVQRPFPPERTRLRSHPWEKLESRAQSDEACVVRHSPFTAAGVGFFALVPA